MSPAIPTVRARQGLQWRTEGACLAVGRETPREEAVGLSFNGRPHTVLMATPDDLRDLAMGFTVTEGVAAFAEIEAVTLQATDQGRLVDILLAPSARARRAGPAPWRAAPAAASAASSAWPMRCGPPRPSPAPSASRPRPCSGRWPD